MPGTRKEPVLVFQGRRTVCHGKVSFPLGFQTEFSPTGPVGFSDLQGRGSLVSLMTQTHTERSRGGSHPWRVGAHRAALQGPGDGL